MVTSIPLLGPRVDSIMVVSAVPASNQAQYHARRLTRTKVSNGRFFHSTLLEVVA